MRSKNEIHLNSDWIELLDILEKFRVKYMIIGGHAFGFHVEPRFTKDLDIWISTTKANALAAYRALAEFGAPLKDCGPHDFTEEGTFYQFGEYPSRVDILMGPPGPSFASAWRERVETEIAGHKAIYVGRKSLIEMKIAANRPKDKVDLRALADSSPFAKKFAKGLQPTRSRKAGASHKRVRPSPGATKKRK